MDETQPLDRIVRLQLEKKKARNYLDPGMLDQEMLEKVNELNLVPYIQALDVQIAMYSICYEVKQMRKLLEKLLSEKEQ